MLATLLLSCLVVLATFIPSMLYALIHLVFLPKRPWEEPLIFFPSVYFCGLLQVAFLFLGYAILRALWATP